MFGLYNSFIALFCYIVIQIYAIMHVSYLSCTKTYSATSSHDIVQGSKLSNHALICPNLQFSTFTS